MSVLATWYAVVVVGLWHSRCTRLGSVEAPVHWGKVPKISTVESREEVDDQGMGALVRRRRRRRISIRWYDVGGELMDVQ